MSQLEIIKKQIDEINLRFQEIAPKKDVKIKNDFNVWKDETMAYATDPYLVHYEVYTNENGDQSYVPVICIPKGTMLFTGRSVYNPHEEESLQYLYKFKDKDSLTAYLETPVEDVQTFFFPFPYMIRHVNTQFSFNTHDCVVASKDLRLMALDSPSPLTRGSVQSCPTKNYDPCIDKHLLKTLKLNGYIAVTYMDSVKQYFDKIKMDFQSNGLSFEDSELFRGCHFANYTDTSISNIDIIKSEEPLRVMIENRPFGTPEIALIPLDPYVDTTHPDSEFNYQKVVDYFKMNEKSKQTMQERIHENIKELESLRLNEPEEHKMDLKKQIIDICLSIYQDSNEANDIQTSNQNTFINNGKLSFLRERIETNNKLFEQLKKEYLLENADGNADDMKFQTIIKDMQKKGNSPSIVFDDEKENELRGILSKIWHRQSRIKQLQDYIRYLQDELKEDKPQNKSFIDYTQTHSFPDLQWLFANASFQPVFRVKGTEREEGISYWDQWEKLRNTSVENMEKALIQLKDKIIKSKQSYPLFSLWKEHTTSIPPDLIIDLRSEEDEKAISCNYLDSYAQNKRGPAFENMLFYIHMNNFYKENNHKIVGFRGGRSFEKPTKKNKTHYHSSSSSSKMRMRMHPRIEKKMSKSISSQYPLRRSFSFTQKNKFKKRKNNSSSSPHNVASPSKKRMRFTYKSQRFSFSMDAFRNYLKTVPLRPTSVLDNKSTTSALRAVGQLVSDKSSERSGLSPLRVKVIQTEDMYYSERAGMPIFYFDAASAAAKDSK